MKNSNRELLDNLLCEAKAYAVSKVNNYPYDLTTFDQLRREVLWRMEEGMPSKEVQSIESTGSRTAVDKTQQATRPASVAGFHTIGDGEDDGP